MVWSNQSAAFSSGKVRPNHETNINIIARRTGKDVNSHTVLDGIITTIMATIQRINIIGSREGSRNRRRLKANQTGKKFRVGIKSNISTNRNNLISFFFQAEDGIRDYKVTGVQTCALPISLVVLALLVGRYPLSLSDLALLKTVVLEIRGPRVLAAALVGAALAAAGTAYQGILRNPLVSPDILGVSSGAALGAAAAMMLSMNVFMVQILAFAWGLAAVALVYWIASRLRGHDPLLALVLTGVVVGTLLGAVVSLLKTLADPLGQLPAITFWLLGSLA